MISQQKSSYTFYRLTNTMTGRPYVGSTRHGIVKRIRRHRQDMRFNNHANRHMQADWNEGNFKIDFEVLTTKVCTKAEAKVIEENFMNKETNPYNIKRGQPGDMTGNTSYRLGNIIYVYKEIRELSECYGYNYTKIKRLYNISQAMVSMIVNGHRVESEEPDTSFGGCFSCPETVVKAELPAASEMIARYKEVV